MKSESIEVDGRTLLSGLVAGIIASTFSIGPLLLVLLGYDVTQAFLLSQYWLYAILAGILFLSVSLVSFSRDRVTKKQGKIRLMRTSELRIRKSDLTASIMVFAFTVLISVYLVTPVTSAAVLGVSPVDVITVDVEGKNYRQLTLKIRGMVCPGCSYGIQRALSDTPGIISAEVSLPDNGVVIYDPSKITKENIVKLGIFTSYYSAEIVEDRPV